MNAAKERRITKRGVRILSAAIAAVLILIAALFLLRHGVGREKAPPEVITVSTLEKIINVRDLSTFTAVYNGIASVTREETAEQPDYYVSYEARVKAGIAMADVQIAVDNNEKIVTVTLPEIEITEVNVDIASLDFIFYNLNADRSTITQEAYKACEEDVTAEAEAQTAILELAKQNAVNIIRALTSPIIEQLDADYRLIVD